MREGNFENVKLEWFEKWQNYPMCALEATALTIVWQTKDSVLVPPSPVSVTPNVLLTLSTFLRNHSSLTAAQRNGVEQIAMPVVLRIFFQ